MQIARLFEIVYILLDKKSVTAGELAERFEVSVRTIYRDIEVLSQAGIPVYTNKGRGGGIGLLEEFVLNKSVLSGEEKNEILWALQGMDAVKAAGGGKTLEKMRLLFGTDSDRWLEVDFSEWGERGEKIFDQVKEAVTQRRVLEFDYYNTRGQKSRRRAEPCRLWFKSKTWYLRAYCRQAEDIRLFRLTRMRNVKVLSEQFERRFSPEQEDEQPSRSQDNVSITLHIDASEAYRVYDEHGEESMRREEDGSFTVTMEMPENEWVYGYILSYGEHARVVGPERVRGIIQGKLDRMRGLYGEREEDGQSPGI